MKALVLVLALLLALSAHPASAHGGGSSGGGHSGSSPVHVQGYTTKNGTVVNSYDRTAPNGTKNDNWSTRGNINPETGVAGAKPGDAGYAGTMPASSDSINNGTENWAVGEERNEWITRNYEMLYRYCRWDGTQWVPIGPAHSEP